MGFSYKGESVLKKCYDTNTRNLIKGVESFQLTLAIVHYTEHGNREFRDQCSLM